jgi:hypothetical protein
MLQEVIDPVVRKETSENKTSEQKGGGLVMIFSFANDVRGVLIRCRLAALPLL